MVHGTNMNVYTCYLYTLYDKQSPSFFLFHFQPNIAGSPNTRGPATVHGPCRTTIFFHQRRDPLGHIRTANALAPIPVVGNNTMVVPPTRPRIIIGQRQQRRRRRRRAVPHSTIGSAPQPFVHQAWFRRCTDMWMQHAQPKESLVVVVLGVELRIRVRGKISSPVAVKIHQ